MLRTEKIANDQHAGKLTSSGSDWRLRFHLLRFRPAARNLHSTMYTDTSMPTNTLLAGFASLPSWIATSADPSPFNIAGSVALSVVLLLLGKLADLAIRVYLENRGERKKKDQSDSTS